MLGETIDQLLNGTLAFNHQAHILESADGRILGWMYFGPTQIPQTWNLWWIGVKKDLHGKGHGSSLLIHFEKIAKQEGATKLLVETSSSPTLEKTRKFYVKHGYTCGKIEASGYGEGQDKLTFEKYI